MILAGIDFSINYSSLSILKDNKIYYFSFNRGERLSKRQKFLISELNKLETFNNINLISHKSQDSDSYSVKEQNKLFDAINIKNEIAKVLRDFNIDIVAIEGFSFSSSSMRALELGGYQYVLRSEIYNLNKEMRIFSPSEIKKVAGKGNYGKLEMFEAYKNKEFEEVEDELKNFILNNEHLCNIKNNIEEPICGLIDSNWVLRTLIKDLR